MAQAARLLGDGDAWELLTLTRVRGWDGLLGLQFGLLLVGPFGFLFGPNIFTNAILKIPMFSFLQQKSFSSFPLNFYVIIHI